MAIAGYGLQLAGALAVATGAVWLAAIWLGVPGALIATGLAMWVFGEGVLFASAQL
jgi:hypothetical protein